MRHALDSHQVRTQTQGAHVPVFVVARWTGRHAALFQEALRLTNEKFAGLLGISVRTVADWHKKRDLEPQPEVRQLLDIALEKASEPTALTVRSDAP
jgi:DNA-binding transcriptional regulator YiaG